MKLSEYWKHRLDRGCKLWINGDGDQQLQAAHQNQDRMRGMPKEQAQGKSRCDGVIFFCQDSHAVSVMDNPLVPCVQNRVESVSMPRKFQGSAEPLIRSDKHMLTALIDEDIMTKI